MTETMIRAIAILVPVHNEETLLPALLASLQISVDELKRTHPDVATTAMFALDRCTDNSARLISDAGHQTVRARLSGVGAAREAAAVASIRAARSAETESLWLANTDADSEVPWNWLIHQVDLADAGADVVVGAVRPRAMDLDEERSAAWEATHRDRRALGHVHGANLGIRANVYAEAGGFRALPEHEDTDLVSRVAITNAHVVASEAHTVTTSGRLIGRTAGGYAGYLREQLLPLAAGSAAETRL